MNIRDEENNLASHLPDTDTYAHMLYLSDFLREPVIRSAIQALHLPSGSRGLDAGCGIGSHTLLLAEAVAPAGRVTGLDLSPEFLVRARKTAKESGLSRHVSFQEGDVNTIPFGDDSFDWVWSADTVSIGPKETGCPAEDPLPLVQELARVVKSGGNILSFSGPLRNCFQDIPFWRPV